VRFEVGHDEALAFQLVERALARHAAALPADVGPPLVTTRSIDDVPILVLALSSTTADTSALRRLAVALEERIRAVPDVARTEVIGGTRDEVAVELDAAALAAHGATADEVAAALAAAGAVGSSGTLVAAGHEALVESGRRFVDLADVADVVVRTAVGADVRVRDLARVERRATRADEHVFLVPGPVATEPRASGATPAVTLSVAKRGGTNAVRIARDVLAVVEAARGTLVPPAVHVQVLRNFGLTAAEKSNELLLHMGLAIVSVTLLIAFALGWREAGIVAIAIPVTLALTLAVFHLLGYTLNRITLFALIFSIGILVDDPIVDVENIVRHFRMPHNRGRNLIAVTVAAVNEVRSPLVLATLTVVCAVLPMAFVSGLMGPYMRPIPIGAGAAMLVSMLVAFVVTPWAAQRVLRGPARRGALGGHGEGEREDWLTRRYRALMGLLIGSARARLVFAGLLGLLLVAALALVPLRAVVVKMLPFDDKSELELVVELPEGTPVERTANVALELARLVAEEAEVVAIGVHAGAAAPVNFNGLVRQYDRRTAPHQADLLVQLAPKHERSVQSHAFARRIRPRVEELAARLGAHVAIAEVPPGPPVLQTLVAEVYGGSEAERDALALALRARFEAHPDVVDVDWSLPAERTQTRFVVDHAKAASHGLSSAGVERALALALSGVRAGRLSDAEAREDVEIVVRLPAERRDAPERLLDLTLRTTGGALAPLAEFVRVESGPAPRAIHHKNLVPVHYVTGDVFGRVESSAYAVLDLRDDLDALVAGPSVDEHWLAVPHAPRGPTVKWDGEMHVTLEVFRDLGLAFAVVLVLIYVLVVGWFKSFTTPLVIMAAIPFSLVGILPAHWAMGAFFTATSIIGFIAGAGIVVRNSIILVDFVEQRLAEGVPLAQAVVDAGAVRFRPMLLTAAAVVAGAGVILFDPIFQGLAISLMAGEIAAMTLSRVAVPVLYERVARRRAPATLGEATAS
jgi:multidrug efflux pump subunit AcrB